MDGAISLFFVPRNLFGNGVYRRIRFLFHASEAAGGAISCLKPYRDMRLFD